MTFFKINMLAEWGYLLQPVGNIILTVSRWFLAPQIRGKSAYSRNRSSMFHQLISDFMQLTLVVISGAKHFALEIHHFSH